MTACGSLLVHLVGIYQRIVKTFQRVAERFRYSHGPFARVSSEPLLHCEQHQQGVRR